MHLIDIDPFHRHFARDKLEPKFYPKRSERLLPPHRSRMVSDFLDSLDGRIAIEYLPRYAPELNPVEYLWGHWKQHTLPNVCPKDLWQLNEGARRTLRRLRRRPHLITAFWKQASSPLD